MATLKLALSKKSLKFIANCYSGDPPCFLTSTNEPGKSQSEYGGSSNSVLEKPIKGGAEIRKVV